MLNDILFETCPECNAIMTSREQKNKHSNGHWNEKVEFSCGSVYRFSPNFMAIENIKSCPDTEEAKQLEKKRDHFALHLVEFIKNFDVDETFKNEVASRLPHAVIKNYTKN